jgi:proteic killer suppression protein
MIKSVSGSATHQFIYSGKSKFSGMNQQIALLRLNELNDANSLNDLGNSNSVGLHKLKGIFRQFWSIDINGPWRIIFKFKNGNAYEVEIIDTH